MRQIALFSFLRFPTLSTAPRGKSVNRPEPVKPWAEALVEAKSLEGKTLRCARGRGRGAEGRRIGALILVSCESQLYTEKDPE